MTEPVAKPFNTVSAYLVVPNCVEALEFYQKAFGAETRFRMPGPDGESTMHAEFRLGDSVVMLTDENPEWQMKSPRTLGGSPVSLHIYTEDVDALFARATTAGCTVLQPVEDMFWGDRFAKVADPYGHAWSMATPKESLTLEEIQERQTEYFRSMKIEPDN